MRNNKHTFTLADAVNFADTFNKSFFDEFELIDDTNTGYRCIEYDYKGYMITAELFNNFMDEVAGYNGDIYKLLYEMATEALNEGCSGILPYEWFFDCDLEHLKDYKIIDWYNSSTCSYSGIIGLTIQKVEA